MKVQSNENILKYILLQQLDKLHIFKIITSLLEKYKLKELQKKTKAILFLLYFIIFSALSPSLGLLFGDSLNTTKIIISLIGGLIFSYLMIYINPKMAARWEKKKALKLKSQSGSD
jgi:LytS/YehU family sensor histidine kinase